MFCFCFRIEVVLGVMRQCAGCLLRHFHGIDTPNANKFLLLSNREIMVRSHLLFCSLHFFLQFSLNALQAVLLIVSLVVTQHRTFTCVTNVMIEIVETVEIVIYSCDCGDDGSCSTGIAQILAIMVLVALPSTLLSVQPILFQSIIVHHVAVVAMFKLPAIYLALIVSLVQLVTYWPLNQWVPQLPNAVLHAQL